MTDNLGILVFGTMAIVCASGILIITLLEKITLEPDKKKINL